MPKVLIAHASVGAGHRSAAKAVENSILELSENNENSLEPIVLDVLSFAPSLFRRLYGKGYEYVSSHMRWLCKLVYGLTDRTGANSKLVQVIMNYSAKQISPLQTLLRENETKHVFCTHFLPITFFCNLRRAGLYHGTIRACITDYQAHAFWIDSGVDHYYVASEDAEDFLKKAGISSSRISIVGIPVRKEFVGLNPPVRSVNTQSYPLKILCIFSSNTYRESLRVLAEIASLNIPLEFRVVCGRNEKLYRQIKNYSMPEHIQYSAHTFVSNIKEYMLSSDIVITKPGGITTTECLCTGLPMLFIYPIPCQEVENAKILAKAGTGIECYKQGSIKSAVQKIFENPAILPKMSRSCLEFAKAYSSVLIAEELIELEQAPLMPQVPFHVRQNDIQVVLN